MRYTLYSYGGDRTAVSAPDMISALALFLAVHPNDEYVVISQAKPEDEVRDNIVYLPPGKEMQNDTVTH